ncbi:MAG TPA: restriction endonuclease subunit S, partial [Pirellula sp.]|nr:restriction endonuclease subunit S [Pirellula sp.]
KIPVPSVLEQQRVVRRINECFMRLHEIEQLRLESIKQARFLESSLYAAISESGEWPRKTVGDVIETSGNGRSIPQDNENANGFVLSLSSVHDVTLDFSAQKPISMTDTIANRYRISDGDVFVSRSNTRDLVGLSSVALNTPNARLIFPDLLIKLVANSSIILPKFLAYVLRTPDCRRQIKDRAVGSSQSMVKISGARLKEIVIPVPPVDVQRSLIRHFDELHDRASQLESGLQAVKQCPLRESILSKAFAGEL